MENKIEQIEQLLQQLAVSIRKENGYEHLTDVQMIDIINSIFTLTDELKETENEIKESVVGILELLNK